MGIGLEKIEEVPKLLDSIDDSTLRSYATFFVDNSYRYTDPNSSNGTGEVHRSFKTLQTHVDYLKGRIKDPEKQQSLIGVERIFEDVYQFIWPLVYFGDARARERTHNRLSNVYQEFFGKQQQLVRSSIF